MSLNGIDVASYQTGIDFGKVPCDFVIVKATQGTNYRNPAYKSQLENAQKNGKLTGVYHYITGAGAEAESLYFYSVIRDQVGKSIICLDWESGSNKAWNNTAYLRSVVQAVRNLTAVVPVVYVQQSAMLSVQKTVPDCPLWIAQYASMKDTGYQSKPWHDTAYKCAIRQYSSRGKLSGWNGYLDLDKFYGFTDEWKKLAQPTGAENGVYTVGGYKLNDVKYGDKGETVRFLQTLLNSKHYACGAADGIAGDKTLHAIAQFQADKRRTVCGKGTWEELLK